VPETWDELMDPYAVEDAEEWIDWPFEAGERAYVLRIEGISMFNPELEKVIQTRARLSSSQI